MTPKEFPLPAGLPEPVDDGACAHLAGTRLPSVALASTAGRWVDLGARDAGRSVVYCYPMTGVPGQALPEGWDQIPGARGCTPEACGFRDHHSELHDLGVEVFGLSTQTSDYQKEMAGRLHLPFEILSDSEFRFCDALNLPRFTIAGMRLVKRLTLVLRAGRIETVFYPVFPPDAHAGEVVQWVMQHPL